MESKEGKLLKALLSKFETVLNAGNDKQVASKDNYIAWCSPGFPFQPEDLDFASKGISGEEASDTNTLIRHASEFSFLANSVPSSNVINSSGTFEQNGSLLWNVYENVLRYSHVPGATITDEDQAKLDKFRALLTVKSKRTTLMGETIETIEPSPLVEAYNNGMAEYFNAVGEYNSKRLSATNEDSRKAVQDFAMNGKNYESRIQTALSSWISKGYKNDFEEMMAFINQTTQRSMMQAKEDLQTQLKAGVMKSAHNNADFYMTSLYPGNFANTDNGWTEFNFSSTNQKSYGKTTASASSTSANLNWGLWSASGGATTKNSDSKVSFESDDFEISFKMTQVTLGRGWFSPNFLLNNTWKWEKDHGLLSDGASQSPKGQLIAYPTTAVFVKDVVIKSSSIKANSSAVSSALSANGSAGWGPFTIKSNYSRDSNELSTSKLNENGEIKIKGLQLIAFKCFALPKTPKSYL